MRHLSKWNWKPQRAMTCDDTAEGRVSHEVNRSTSLRCACHSCDWTSCPPACGGMKCAHRNERAGGAPWGGGARRTGVGVAAGVPSPPPGDYTGHDRTGSKVTHGANTMHAKGNSHLVQRSCDPRGNWTDWWSRERALHAVTWLVTHPLRAILTMSRAGRSSTQIKNG